MLRTFQNIQSIAFVPVKVLADFGKFLADGHKRKQVVLSAFATEFLHYAKPNYASHSVYLYEKELDHFKRICGDLPLDKITAKHFDLYKVARLHECVQARLGVDELHRRCGGYGREQMCSIIGP